MHCEARLLAFESWMDAAVRGGDWTQSLEVSARVLGARSAIGVWYDVTDGSPTVCATSDISADLLRLCTQLAETERAGCEHFAGVGCISWLHAQADGELDGELTFFTLADGPVDVEKLSKIATVAVRAISTRSKLKAVRATSALKTAAFDQLPFGMVIVDKHVRIAERNEACGALLARADGLAANHDKLACREPADQAALMIAVGRALSGDLTGAILKVHRNCGAQPYVVRVVAPRGEGGGPDHCLLMIVDPDDEPSPGSEIWRAMFDLTDCELIIAEGLVSGRRITEIANQRGVSIETVRSQTKRMFERLNVSSQAEAAARLSRSAPFKLEPV